VAEEDNWLEVFAPVEASFVENSVGVAEEVNWLVVDASVETTSVVGSVDVAEVKWLEVVASVEIAPVGSIEVFEVEGLFEVVMIVDGFVEEKLNLSTIHSEG